MPDQKAYLLLVLVVVTIYVTNGARYPPRYKSSKHGGQSWYGHGGDSWYKTQSHCESRCTQTGQTCQHEPHGPYNWCCTSVDCGPLENPEHGEVHTPFGTKYGRHATYVCEEGYNLEGGPSPRTCTETGWSGTIPSCRAACPKPIEPCHSHVTYLTTDVGAIATYECDEGYELVGDVERQCTPDGWTGSPPCCEEIHCPPLVHPEHGIVTLPNGTRYDAEAHFECDDCFTLVGEETSTCLANGSWSGEVTCAATTYDHNGDTFYFFTCPRNWHVAQSICQRLGGNLVTITDTNTNNFLLNIIKSLGNDTWWTGLNDEDSEDNFVWVADGMPLGPFEYWGLIQPNNRFGDEDCVNFYAPYDHDWFDDDCRYAYNFICQYED